MYRMHAMLYGALAGAAGAALWAAIAYLANMEIGWIAWGVGLAVGVGVAVGNEGEGSLPAGVLAAALAAGSVVVGKYATVQLMLPNETELVSNAVASLDDTELLVSYVADEVVAEYGDAGRAVVWPAGADSLQPAEEADYPPAIWAEALARWNRMRAEDQLAFRAGLEAQIQASAAELRNAMSRAGFLGTFGLLDIVFFALAVFTAFRIARAGGLRKEDPYEATG